MPKFLILNNYEIKNVCKAYYNFLTTLCNEYYRTADPVHSGQALAFRTVFCITCEEVNPFELANDIVHTAFVERDLKALMAYYNELSTFTYFMR